MVYYEIWGIEEGETECVMLFKFPETACTAEAAESERLELERRGVKETQVKKTEE